MRKWLSFCLIAILLLTSCTMAKEEKKVSQNVEKSIDDNYRTYYEIFLYSYYDSNGDGIGDLEGLLEKLDYINDGNPETNSDLECTGIYLMPIMPAVSYHKYDVTEYCAIDSEYGTMEQFESLLHACNKRNIKVIIDLVLNHTSAKHPWFIRATDYIKRLKEGEEPSVNQCPYFAYYNFTREAEGRETYYPVGETGWYYEARFWDQMPDLNLDSEMVRQQIKEIIDFWMKKGVGGFRLDAAKEYYLSTTKNVEFLSWIKQYVKNKEKTCYLVAEVWDTLGTIATYYESGIDSIFNYEFGDSGGMIARTVRKNGKRNAGQIFAKNVVEVEAIFTERNPAYIDASFISNHDNDRSVGYVGYEKDSIKVMCGLNMMMRGSSFLYYGEEIGLTGSGRDENKRKPMYWRKGGDNGRTKGPIDMEMASYRFPSVEEQEQDESSILQYYKEAIRIRNKNPEIARGNQQVMEEVKEGAIAGIEKTYQGSSIYILVNLSKDKKRLSISKRTYPYKKVEESLSVTKEKPTLEGEELELPGYAIAILR